MYLENGIISERQAFRIGLLENITIGIVVVPYITTRVAGTEHIWAFGLGMILTCLYGLLVYGFSKWFPEGLAEAINNNLGWPARLIDFVYAMRYVLRSAVILLFFATVIHAYMLRSMNMWLIAVPFSFICGYGALRDIERRGRLLEMLFWWMLVPLILVAVFAISNVEWRSLPEELWGGADLSGTGSFGRILQGAYLVFLVLSGMELMIFTLPRQKQNNWKNGLKMLVWIVIAITLAYTFIIGILGVGWTRSDSTAALNVMEASAFPGGLVERLDYPVLAFWVIGVFAVISGYLFYAREFACLLISHHEPDLQKRRKKNSHDTERMGKQSLIVLALIAVLLLAMWGWSSDVVSRWMAWYMVWIDVGIGVLVPLIVALVRYMVQRRRDDVGKKRFEQER